MGKLFRPDNPLLPNYKYVPIGYHGRSSSIVASGAPVRRPRGQRKAPNDAAPSVGPSRRLDYELELGAFVAQGNALGEPIHVSQMGRGDVCITSHDGAARVCTGDYLRAFGAGGLDCVKRNRASIAWKVG